MKPFCNKLQWVVERRTTLGGGTATSGGGTPDTGCGTPFQPVPNLTSGFSPILNTQDDLSGQKALCSSQ